MTVIKIVLINLNRFNTIPIIFKSTVYHVPSHLYLTNNY